MISYCRSRASGPKEARPSGALDAGIGAGSVPVVISGSLLIGPLGRAPSYPCATCSRKRSRSPRSSRHTKNVVAVSLFAVGGAIAASGVALVILNQPRTVRADEQARAAVTPLIGPGVFGLSLALER